MRLQAHFDEAASKGETETLKGLLEKYKHHHLQTSNALDEACRHGHLAAVQFLLPLDTSAGKYRHNPLHEAAGNGHTEITKYLVRTRYKENSSISIGLLSACKNNKYETAKMLLHLGARS